MEPHCCIQSQTLLACWREYCIGIIIFLWGGVRSDSGLTGLGPLSLSHSIHSKQQLWKNNISWVDLQVFMGRGVWTRWLCVCVCMSMWWKCVHLINPTICTLSQSLVAHWRYYRLSMLLHWLRAYYHTQAIIPMPTKTCSIHTHTHTYTQTHC